MVKWDDPSLLLKDFSASCVLRVSQYPVDSYLVALIKLYHAIGGIYMYVHLHEPPRRKWELISTWENFSWETVITAGFELDVLRRKRPYRWTIWVSSLLYLRRHPQLKEK